MIAAKIKGNEKAHSICVYISKYVKKIWIDCVCYVDCREWTRAKCNFQKYAIPYRIIENNNMLKNSFRDVIVDLSIAFNTYAWKIKLVWFVSLEVCISTQFNEKLVIKIDWIFFSIRKVKVVNKKLMEIFVYFYAFHFTERGLWEIILIKIVLNLKILLFLSNLWCG